MPMVLKSLPITFAPSVESTARYCRERGEYLFGETAGSFVILKS